MTLVQLVAADFDESVPQLLRGASVVALVPATDLKGWAAEMAWQVARAAAGGGRRTALVDCFVDAPSLHTIGGTGNDEGLVDVFEYGASLNRIVQQQPQANLFFIPSGTYSPDAQPLMQNPRWRRLSAGFRHEEALLLLYVAAEHLAGLAAEPDGVVVLAPRGLDVSIADFPALTEAVGRGMQILAVVADEEALPRGGERGREKEGETAPAEPVAAPAPAPAPAAIPSPSPLPHYQPARRSRPRASAPMAMLVEANKGNNWPLAVGAMFGLLVLSSAAYVIVTQTSLFDRAPAADSAVTTTPAAAQVPPPVEPLPFTIQITALPTLAAAFAVADSLEARGARTIIAPVRLQGRETFYRVHTGPYATAARADSALAALRLSGILAPNVGATVTTPLSVPLGGPLTRDGANAERNRLRQAGVPAFILGDSLGTFSLYAGAYDAAAQATLLQDLLTPTGGAGQLAPRTGYVP